MTRASHSPFPIRPAASVRGPLAFSLIEVVLAIGVLSLAVVAMLGLFAPTMNSVKQVVDGNKATALVGMINAQVNENMDYDDIGDGLATGGPMYFYAWERERTAGNKKFVDIVMTEPNGAANTPATAADLNGDGNTTAASPFSDRDGGVLAGPAFVVTFDQLTLGAGNYTYGNYTDEAYIPFLVTIYQLDLNQGFDRNKLTEANRVLSYPSAKLR